MILGEQKHVGKRKKYTIASITRDLQNGAWNNLDLTLQSKRALIGAGLIILVGAASAYNYINKK